MCEKFYFEYGKKETDWLSGRDEKLGRVIAEIGYIEREVHPDLFESLIRNIVGQQISGKARDTVCARLCERFSPLTPEALASAAAEDIQSCGTSMRKAGYIKGAAEAVARGELDLERLHALSDDEVRAALSKLRGIGMWTAEMLMIFSMGRPDILSRGDLAIIRGMRMIYGHLTVTKEIFEGLRKIYSPYSTTASLYIWAVAGGACPHLKDPAAK
ncbi:MAG: DNA-3-methyladenine glycosylase 2 family protein [Clostridiales bacterium]|nr:DNA-3-methyladenine glycosylase 2 family protein [Clostridiales bacterium]